MAADADWVIVELTPWREVGEWCRLYEGPIEHLEPRGVGEGVQRALQQLERRGAMYVYIQSEPGLWTVGFYDPQGAWVSESDWPTREEAAARVHWLNGGE